MRRSLLLPLALAAATAGAQDWSGRVTAIRAITVSPAVLFSLSGELKSPARCNEYGMYAIDLNAPGGLAQFELVKFAMAHDLQVAADSLNTCAVYWKAEGVKEVQLLR